MNWETVSKAGIRLDKKIRGASEFIWHFQFGNTSLSVCCLFQDVWPCAVTTMQLHWFHVLLRVREFLFNGTWDFGVPIRQPSGKNTVSWDAGNCSFLPMICRECCNACLWKSYLPNSVTSQCSVLFMLCFNVINVVHKLWRRFFVSIVKWKGVLCP